MFDVPLVRLVEVIWDYQAVGIRMVEAGQESLQQYQDTLSVSLQLCLFLLREDDIFFEWRICQLKLKIYYNERSACTLTQAMHEKIGAASQSYDMHAVFWKKLCNGHQMHTKLHRRKAYQTWQSSFCKDT